MSVKLDFDRAIVESEIKNQDYFFYMRTAEQWAFDVRNKEFTEDRFRYAYILEDMAGLISSHEIGNFLRHHAELFRSNRHATITRENLELIKAFLNDAYQPYLNIEFIDLQKAQQNA